MTFPILSALIVLPVIGGLAVLLVRRDELALPLAIASSLVTFGGAVWLLFAFESGEPGFQFVEKSTWHQPWGVGWHVGVDGISLLMVVLTAFLFPIALLASTAITQRVRQYAASMLFLQAGITGVFLALDLLVFFIFWEAMLVPMYFIIGTWGGERRVHAAVKFFLFTAFGSALMFAAILSLGFLVSDQLGGPTFDFVELLGARLRSRSRYFHSTPGCPMPTSRHLPPVR
jgi:NADH-quinone oxidoreductase subunit M